MSDPIVKRRLYVGGLAENITEDELRERFTRFVNVSNLTLKTRTDSEGNHIKAFAHLDIRGTEENIRKCFSAYQNAKWKGSVMKIQDAKESFLDRLEAEREENRQQNLDTDISATKTDMEWKPPEFEKLNGAPVPGTPIPGKKDWVVGKYGRLLPILNVKKSYKTKSVKHDPSKFCHAAKVFKDDSDVTSSSTCHTLTWEIDTPDSEITKKRKGEFLPSPSPKKAKPFPVHLLSSSESYPTSSSHNSKATSSHLSSHKSEEDLEIVKLGHNKAKDHKVITRSRFDSDYESDSEAQPVNKTSQDGTTRTADSPPSLKKSDKNLKKSQKSDKNLKKLDKNLKKSDKNGTEKRVKNVSIESPVSAKKMGKKILDTNETDSGVKSKSKKKNKTMNADSSSSSHKTAGKSLKRAQEMTSSFERGERGDEEDDSVTITSGSCRKIPAFKGIGSLITKGSGQFAGGNSSPPAKAGIARTQLDKRKVKECLILPQPSESADEDDDSESDDDREKRSDDDGDNEEERAGNHGVTEETTDDSGEDEDNDDDVGETKNIKDGSHSKSVLNSPPLKMAVKENRNAKPDRIPVQTEISLSSSFHNSQNANAFLCKNHLASKTFSTKMVAEWNVVSKPQKKTAGLVKPDLSEFVAEAPEVSDGENDSSDHGHDLYDSDLDSNDFKLVAKKLAMQAAQGKSQKLPANGKGKMQTSSIAEDSQSRRTILKEAGTEYANEGKNTKPKKVLSFQHKQLQAQANLKLGEKVEDAVSSESTTRQTGSLSKQEADNAKRLQALKAQAEMRQRKRSWMRMALSYVDTASSQRIVFCSSEEEGDGDGAENKKKKASTASSKVQEQNKPGAEREDLKPQQSHVKLLGGSSDEESEDEDVGEMFKSKPQFEGKKGEKLMKMQKRFGDSRFKLDEKFVDSDSSDEDDGEDNDKREEGMVLPDKSDDANSLAAERKRNLQVLETVVGKHKVDRLTAKLKRDTIKIVDMSQLRFDPTKVNTTQQLSPPRKDSTTSKRLKQEEREQMSEKEMLEKSSKKNKNKETERPKDEAALPTTEATKSKVTLSDSLVEMLRPKTKGVEGVGGEGDNKPHTSFSLSDMFDQKESKESGRGWLSSSQTPLAGLLSPKNAGRHADKETDRPRNSKRDRDPQKKIQENVSEEETGSQADTLKPGLKPLLSLQENDGTEQGDEGSSSDDDGDDDDNKDDTMQVDSVDVSLDPTQKREKVLRDAGRMDIRFSKQEWLERFSEIRHDLLLTCKKRFKDAKRRKRMEEENSRKKAVLKKASKGQWWRKK